MDTVATGEHGSQNPSRLVVGQEDVEGTNFAYALDSDGDTSPDSVAGDYNHDGVPNYLDAFDPSGTVYIGATGNAVSGVQIRLIHSGSTLGNPMGFLPRTLVTLHSKLWLCPQATVSHRPLRRISRMQVFSMPAANTFLVSNTACASYVGNSSNPCGAANLTLNSTLGMSLTPNNAASEVPGQTVTHNHTLW